MIIKTKRTKTRNRFILFGVFVLLKGRKLFNFNYLKLVKKNSCISLSASLKFHLVLLLLLFHLSFFSLFFHILFIHTITLLFFSLFFFSSHTLFLLTHHHHHHHHRPIFVSSIDVILLFYSPLLSTNE